MHMSKGTPLTEKQVVELSDAIERLAMANGRLRAELKNGGFLGQIKTDGGENYVELADRLKRWARYAEIEISELPKQRRRKESPIKQVITPETNTRNRS